MAESGASAESRTASVCTSTQETIKQEMNKYILLLLFVLLTACTQREIFSEFNSFHNAEWDRLQAIRFEAPVYDISVPYQVSIELRHNDQYPFRNIWLFVEYQAPSGKMWTDTLGTDLADSYGKWYGKGISLYSCSFNYQENVQYPDTGIYVYTIRHGMRADVLKGISDVGLRISKE